MTVRVGFTGTRQGMTPLQKAALVELLSGMAAGKVVAAHHGGCVGADIEFDQLWGRHGPRDGTVVVHPSNLKSCQGHWRSSAFVREEKAPLERNRDIVAETDLLIATPKESMSVLRSGTWATIRYAKQAGKPIYVIYPDGSVWSDSLVFEVLRWSRDL